MRPKTINSVTLEIFRDIDKALDSPGRMELGFVYFVFMPSVVTTLFTGKAVARFGTRRGRSGARLRSR